MAGVGLAPKPLARHLEQEPRTRRVVEGAPPLLTVEQAEAILPEWRDLGARSAEANVFFHPGILLPAMRCLGSDSRVVAIRDSNGAMIGLAPLRRARLGRLAPIVEVWVHDYGPLGTPLFDAHSVDRAVASLLQAAPQGLAIPFTAVDGPVAAAIRETAARLGRPVACVGRHSRAVLERRDVSKSLRAALPTRRRKELARQMRRLADVGTVTVELATEPDHVRARFEEFLVLEAAGWKGAQGTALASDAATTGFSRDIVFNRSERGTVRIASLRLSDHPVAIVVCFVAGSSAFTWKIAHDEAFARFSPGAQLMLETANALFDDSRIERIDSCASANHPMIDHLWPGRMAVATMVIGPAGGGLAFRAGLAALTGENRARAVARDLRSRIRGAHVSKEAGS